jgi:hypothetical protein
VGEWGRVWWSWAEVCGRASSGLRRWLVRLGGIIGVVFGLRT